MDRKVYAVLGIIFVLSLVLLIFFHYFPVSVVGDLAGVPAIVALFSALFVLSRDTIANERAIRMEESKNRFALGAMSHMASVAFDKHVSFCEEYIYEVNQALGNLFRRGPHESALESVPKLIAVRMKWIVWLTPEINERLIKFENAITNVGSSAWLMKQLEPGEDRSKALNEAYSTFAAVMGWGKWRGQEIDGNVASEKIIEGLREVLGTAELTRLRTALVSRAMENLNEVAPRAAAPAAYAAGEPDLQIEAPK
jgi:hypothetical protein